MHAFPAPWLDILPAGAVPEQARSRPEAEAAVRVCALASKRIRFTSSAGGKSVLGAGHIGVGAIHCEEEEEEEEESLLLDVCGLQAQIHTGRAVASTSASDAP